MSSQDSKLARLYSRALLDESTPAEWDGIQSALEAFSREYLSNEELRGTLTHPLLPRAERETVVREVSALFSPDQKLAHLLVLLVENGRIAAVDSVAREFAALVSAQRKEWRFTVQSAFELEGAEKSDIETSLQKDFGSSVKVEYEVDVDLIGGLRVSLGDLVYDDSIKGRLAGLREQLLGEV